MFLFDYYLFKCGEIIYEHPSTLHPVLAHPGALHPGGASMAENSGKERASGATTTVGLGSSCGRAAL